MNKHRALLWSVWALAPVGLLAFHFGPGQSLLAGDRAGALVRASIRADATGDALGALSALDAAIAALPPGAPPERRLALELAACRAQIRSGQMLEGMARLDTLIPAAEKALGERAPLSGEARSALGEAGYHAAWLMRREGATPDEWKPVAEGARQQFRLLAERAKASGNTNADAHKKNLESVIRLEQMDLSELMGLALPKKCPNCCNNLSQRAREQRLSKCQNKGDEEKDARQKIKGAGDSRRSGQGS